MKKAFFLFLGFSFLFCPLSGLRAEDSLLKIQVLPDQTTADTGMMFIVDAQVLNASPDTSTGFWSNTCSYEKHWVTDNPMVFIQSWTCNENALEEITLGPGDVYQKNIILYVSKKDESGPVLFRMGFKRMSENGDVAEPLWSDPITMRVVVPEAMREVAPSPDEEDASEMPEQPIAAPAEMGEASQPADSEPPALVGDRPLVFEDPGIPIEVKPGDEFSISLVSNPSTGFRWKLNLPENDKTVRLLGSEHVVSDEVMPGVPGHEVYRFKAVTSGEVKADFVYHRPWETVTAPTRKIFTILVEKDEKALKAKEAQ